LYLPQQGSGQFGNGSVLCRKKDYFRGVLRRRIDFAIIGKMHVKKRRADALPQVKFR
jgi:hypothetical protein